MSDGRTAARLVGLQRSPVRPTIWRCLRRRRRKPQLSPVERSAVFWNISNGVEYALGVKADHACELQKLHDVDPPLPVLNGGNKRLVASELARYVDLLEASLAPILRDEFR